MKPQLIYIFIILSSLLIGFILGYFVKSDSMFENVVLFPKVCEYNGKKYNNNDSFPSIDGCNSCGCDNGQIVCTTMACL